MANIYERIRDLRIKRGMTQDDLAKAMGYKDRSMITKIESGKVDISKKKIEKFAEILGTTAPYLMGWEEDHQIISIETLNHPLHPTVIKLLDDIIEEKETNRQKNEKRRQEELKLIHILDKLSDEGREYLLQQAEIALRAYGERK